MAEDRIDIVVTDRGADKAATNIRKIGTEAERSQTYVERLKLSLASVNGTATQKLAAASGQNTSALLKEQLAQERLAAAQARTQIAQARLATETARQASASAAAERAALALASAQGNVAKQAMGATTALEAESAAQARIAAMVDASLAKQAAGMAGSGGNLGGPVGSRKLAAAQAELMAASAAAPAATTAIKEAEAAAESLGTRTPGFFAAFKTGATGAFDTVRDFVTGNGSRFRGVAKEVESGLAGVGSAAAAASPKIRGSSTIIRELLVIMREASVGNFTRMAGSVSILAGALGLLKTVLIPVIVVLGTLAAAMKLFQVSIQDDANKALEEHAAKLGLTTKEMRKLKDETVDAKGKLKELNAIDLTFGDVFQGLKKTLADTFNIDPAMKKMKSMAFNALSDIASAFFDAAAQLSGVFVAVYNGAKAVWAHFPAMMGDFFAQAVNKAAEIMEDMINDAIQGINKFAQKANSLIGYDLFGQISNVHIPRMKNDFAGAGAYVGKVITDGYKTGHDNAVRFDRDFMARWKKNSIDAGMSRADALAAALKGNRNPKAAKTSDPKTQSDYLADENKKLDDQLRRMDMLKNAREVQQHLDEIEEAFIKRRMPLDHDQLEAFRAKLVAVQEGTRRQAEMDRIYEESTGATQKYNDVVAATNVLLGKNAISATEASVAINEAKRAIEATNDAIGANAPLRSYQEALDKIALSLDRKGITQDQANQQTVIANRTYQQAIDPLFRMNEALAAAEVQSKLYGDAVKQQTYYEQVRQEFLAKGIELDKTWTEGQNASVDAIMRRNNALQQQNYIQSQLGQVLNPILDAQKEVDNQANVYAELQRLRETDQINEQAYQQAKYALWVKYNQQKLNNAASFFGALANITANGTGAIGVIHKAAAIAEATIQGFVAAQQALASSPPPFNFIAAAAVGLATGANIAGILSTNVGGYKDGGQFIVGGRDGVDRNNINMDVTKGERVTIETVRQQRANDNAPGMGAPEVHVPIKIVNLQSKQEVLDHMASSEGERVILNVISDNPSLVRNVAGTK